LPDMHPALFERWLALFKQTAEALFEERISTEFCAKAMRIAESLKLALFYRPDRPWPVEDAR
jgi:hemoglobin